MSNYATISNATFAAACAAVPGPFGPLTRVGDLEAATVPVPNSHIRFAVTGQGGLAFYISYDEMSRAGVRNDVLREAYGLPYIVNELKTFIEVLYNASLQMDDILTATAEEYRDVFNLFKYYPAIIGLTPVHSFSEMSKSNELVASFTMSGTGATRAVVNTSTGYDQATAFWIWDWGDGEYSYVENPTPHTYAVDGTYDVRLLVGGRGGFSISPTDSEVVNVP